MELNGWLTTKALKVINFFHVVYFMKLKLTQQRI